MNETMIDELLFTMEIARKSMPEEAHPVHKARMMLIERMIKRSIETDPEYWRESFQRAEQIADETVLRQRAK